MRWKQAVWRAVQREAGRSGGGFTRQELIAHELGTIVADTGAKGRTPAQTLSRELQELRDAGVVLFDGHGQYRLATASANELDVGKAIATQVEQRVKARLGQGRFRATLMQRWEGRCPLTGIDDAPLLRASHIVAWSACTVELERLDPDNGLLLSALWDAAFDRGLVSFGDGGEAYANPSLGRAAREALKIEGAPKLLRLTPGNRERLQAHRAFCATGQWPTP